MFPILNGHVYLQMEEFMSGASSKEKYLFKNMFQMKHVNKWDTSCNIILLLIFFPSKMFTQRALLWVLTSNGKLITGFDAFTKGDLAITLLPVINLRRCPCLQINTIFQYFVLCLYCETSTMWILSLLYHRRYNTNSQLYLNFLRTLALLLPSSLIKGYDPVHIPSLHPWYISWQIWSPRGVPSNGGYELFPLRFRLINTLCQMI